MLDECAGRFVCDARGIGVDWEPRELRRIVKVLRGHADAVRVNAELAADFEQITETWYEKALIPYIYLRLAKHFSYEKVNDAHSAVAAANGQFLMMRRDVYDAIGGHACVAGELLEDVALAIRVKSAGQRIWFGSGRGIVRVRMYRSFVAMWQGWKKNLYRLMGGRPWAAFREIESNGLLLGISEEATYAAVKCPFRPGDRCILYTDGALEAKNAAQEEFGSARLLRFLESQSSLGATPVLAAFLTELARWSGRAEGSTQEDDITLIAVDFQRIPFSR